MRLSKVLVIAAGLGATITACNESESIVPSANIVTEERTPSQVYSGVEITSVFDVDIQFSSTEEIVEIEVNENLAALVDIRVVNNRLRIELKDNLNISGAFFLKAHIKTGNLLTYLSVSDASKLTISDPIVAEEVSLDISDAGYLDGNIEARSLQIYMDDATNMKLRGFSEFINIHSSGASVLDAFALATDKATIDMTGNSQINLTINGLIDVRAKDASSLFYKGTGSINEIDLDEGSQVVQID